MSEDKPETDGLENGHPENEDHPDDQAVQTDTAATEPEPEDPSPATARTTRAAVAQPAKPPARATVLTVVSTVVVMALVAAAVTFGVLWMTKSSELDAVNRAAADRAAAEKAAATYAVGASTFDYRDLTPWRNAMTTGVSPELKTKIESVVGAMNQLLQPLQWGSKATLRDAVANSQSGSMYKVSVYLQIVATNVQVPAGRTFTTVYDITLDKDKHWEISDSGLPSDALGPNGQNGAAAPSSTQAPAATPAPEAPR